jgi:hypothetical protein
MSGNIATGLPGVKRRGRLNYASAGYSGTPLIDTRMYAVDVLWSGL